MKVIASTIWGNMRKSGLRMLTIALTMLFSSISVSAATNYGHIWLADKHSILLKLSAETGAVELSLPILEEKDVHLALDDKQQTLWLAREHGPIFGYDYTGALKTTLDLSVLMPQLTSIDTDQYDDDHDDEDFDEFDIEDMLIDKRDGSLWLALEHHLVKLSPTGELLLNVPTSKELKEIALDIADNSVWLSTEHSVYSIDANTGYIKTALVLPPKKDDPAKTAEVEDLAFDLHLNELWVMTEKQLLRYKRDGTMVLNQDGIEPVDAILDDTILIKN